MYGNDHSSAARCHGDGSTYDLEGVASKRDGNDRLQGLLEGSIIIFYY